MFWLPALAIGSLAVLVLGTSACSKNTSKPNPDQIKEQQTPPQKDIPYSRSCFVDETCPWYKKRAAIYDYVGATYGKNPGEVLFLQPDGKNVATMKEWGIVDTAFGRLEPGPDNILTYLHNGKVHFWNNNKIGSHPACKDELATEPIILSNKKLGTGLVLYGHPSCGVNYAIQLGKSGLELSMAAEPENWAFFLEGAGTELYNEKKHQESELFKKIAETLKIDIKNPLPFDQYSPDVIKKAAADTPYSYEDLAAALTVQLMFIIYNKDRKQDFQEVYKNSVVMVGNKVKADLDTLFERVEEFYKAYPTHEARDKEMTKRLKILAETASKLSESGLRKDLEEHAKGKSAPKALFVVGKGNEGLFKTVYEK